ncbi:MAG: hypothetical protein QG602_3708 [Verrucomicrobiota bacterium]|nr:hypothetical protein [Verrucomicrobiota bacterium]
MKRLADFAFGAAVTSLRFSRVAGEVALSPAATPAISLVKRPARPAYDLTAAASGLAGLEGREFDS